MTDQPAAQGAEPTFVLPSDLAQFATPPGLHRRGMKIGVFGPAGGGKSFLLAHFPSPKLVIDATDEGGISTFLQPNDIHLTLTDPDRLARGLDTVLEHEDYFKSFVIDGFSGTWETFMDYWSAKLGGQIQGGDWRKVKGPWKVFLRKMMRSKVHIGLSMYLRDIAYEQTEPAPGVQKLEIRTIDTPQTEKTVPYILDFLFKAETVLDRKRVPQPFHTLTTYKCRRPRSVPPTELFIGRQWKFSDKAPVNPWEAVIEPFIQYWNEGAVDHLGMDPQEADTEMSSMEATAADLELARVLQLIERQSTMEEFRMVWAREIDPQLVRLGRDRVKLVEDAKNKKKNQLMEAGK